MTETNKYDSVTKRQGVYKKLLTFQKSVEAIKKDNRNDHFKSKYFDINGLLSEVKPKLNDVGLIVLQVLDGDKLITKIIDVEDESEISCAMALTLSTKPQEIGSWISYARRYSLQALLGLEGEDDDGNHASNIPTTRTTTFRGGKFGGKS